MGSIRVIFAKRLNFTGFLYISGFINEVFRICYTLIPFQLSRGHREVSIDIMTFTLRRVQGGPSGLYLPKGLILQGLCIFQASLMRFFEFATL